MKLKSLLDFAGDGYISLMTDEESRSLLQLVMLEQEVSDLSNADDKMKELFETDMSVQLITKRLSYHGIKATPSAVLHAAMHSDGKPATMVMWCYTFAHIAQKRGKDDVTMSDLCIEFGEGFPTERAKRECWDAQKQAGDCNKGISDNKMDVPSNWV